MLKTTVGTLELDNPVLSASGTFGSGWEGGAFVDLGPVGGLVSKTVTLSPRHGNPPPRIQETPSGMLNSIGLENKGADWFLAETLPRFLASDRARFRFPGSEYGLVVGAHALPTLVGGPMAKELIFTGRVVDAEEAERIGLVNHTVGAEAFDAKVEELAGAIAKASPLALKWSKQTINTAITGGNALAVEQQADLLLRGGPDHKVRFGAATRRVTGR